MPRIFISYRRQDSEDITGRIHDRLSNHFHNKNVFMDTTHIPYGADFKAHIKAEIEKSDIVLVMIGEQWASLKDDDGNIRIFGEGDYVKYEVEAAISLESVETLPILVSDGAMPKESEIPQSLHSLTKINAPKIRSGADFNNDIANLIGVIEQRFPTDNQANEVPESNADLPTSSNSDESKSCFTTVRVIIGSIASILIFLVTITTFGIDIVSEDQMNEFREFVGITTSVPAATQIPETRLADIVLIERSSTIERNAIRIPLDNIASDPQNLQFAPSQFGSAIWGYSTADSRLFALDVASGQALSIAETNYFDLSIFENALITTSHYDGTWLWFGDSRNHRLIALDPVTLEITIEYEFGDSGQPTHITQTGDILWITLRDRGELVGLTVDHDETVVDNFCGAPIEVGESPYLIRSQGNSALWVVYGRNSSASLRRIAVTGCIMDDPISLGVEATGLAVFQDQVYLSLNGELVTVENDILSDSLTGAIRSIDQVYRGNNGLWLISDDQLIAFDPSTNTSTLSIMVNASPQSVFVFGSQLWVVLDNMQIVRYVIPDLIVNNVVSLFASNQRVFVITQNGLTCPIDDASPCNEMALEEPVSRTTNDTFSEYLWLMDENNGLWRTNIMAGNSERIITLPITPSIMELDSEGLLWLSDGISYLSVLDVDSQQLTDLLQNSFNLIVPVSITHDGATTWFAYQFPDRISAITLDNSTLREMPLAVDLNSLNLLTADNQYIYAIEEGMVAVIQPQSGEVITRQGTASSLSQTIIVNETLYSLGTDGAIYSQVVVTTEN